MATFNCEDTIGAAVDSILAQTYPNWELIVCDDGSTDRTLAILERRFAELDAGRAVLLRNETNRKLAYSLNRCLEASSAELVARMDGDDLSEPDRLWKQVEFLEQHPDIDVVGTAMRRFNEQGDGEVMHPMDETPDRWSLAKGVGSPFFHATILMRRNAYEAVGRYTVSWRTERGQDLDLWYKFFAAGLQGRNMREALYRVREDAAAIRRRTPRARIGGFVTRLKGNWALRYPPSAYARATVDALKIFIPYKVFDWHRKRSYDRAKVSQSTAASA
jgi:glycosyltransferase EpsE